jgi:hypothetical protein
VGFAYHRPGHETGRRKPQPGQLGAQERGALNGHVGA